MKMRSYSKFTALILTVSMLLSCMIMPSTALGTDEGTIITLDDSISSENLQITGESILKADDPIISEESMILRYVDGTQFDQANHVTRLTELEDLNTYVFANANGTRTVYYMDENVKFVDAEGNVKEKDIELVSKAQGFGIKESNIHLLIVMDLEREFSVLISVIQIIQQEVSLQTEMCLL